jgi:hypothetical protein
LRCSRRWRRWRPWSPLAWSAARQNGVHSATFHLWRPLDDGDIRQALGNVVDLGAGNLGMRRLTATEPHDQAHLVPLFQEPPRRARTHLQVVIVSPGS